MPEQVQLFRLFVGAPSDVDEALDVIRGHIDQWNRSQGPLAKARLELTNWRTHSHPSAGDRPQSIINRQVVDQCDILVAIFRSRFGTPTGVAGSGTEEEIRRCIRKRKLVMVYFEHRPIPRKRKDRNEFARIERFKRKIGKEALYHSYNTAAGLDEVFGQHLAGAMHELLKKYGKR